MYGLVRLTSASGRASENTGSWRLAGPGRRDVDRPGRSAAGTCKGQIYIPITYYTLLLPMPAVTPTKFVMHVLSKWRGYACNPQAITGMRRPLREHGLSRQ